MKKSLYPLLILAALFAALYFTGCKKAEDKPAEPQIVQLKPERGAIVQSVASTGRVASNLDVEIKCKASGQIVSLPFDISDSVTVGQLVLELDPIDEERNVSKAKVSLSSSKARLSQSQQNLSIAESNLETGRRKANVTLETAKVRAIDERAKADRMKQLYEQKLAGQEEYETAETAAVNAEAAVETAQIQLEELDIDEAALELKKQDVNLAKADVESQQINLEIAVQRLDDTKVYAPIDGIVTERFVQTGQIISSGISTTGGGTAILTLSDLSRIFILASVDESDIGNVVTGQKTVITADAYPGKGFEGVVERISPKGVNTSNVVTFEVRIEVTSENKSLLRPEMTANVEIIIAEKEDALIVPVGAISRIQGKYSVSVLKADGGTETRPVEIGISNGVQMEITSGLTENDTIVFTAGESFSRWRSEGGPPRPSNPLVGGGLRH